MKAGERLVVQRGVDLLEIGWPRRRPRRELDLDLVAAGGPAQAGPRGRPQELKVLRFLRFWISNALARRTYRTFWHTLFRICLGYT